MDKGGSRAREARSESSRAGDWSTPGAAPAPRGGRPTSTRAGVFHIPLRDFLGGWRGCLGHVDGWLRFAAVFAYKLSGGNGIRP